MELFDISGKRKKTSIFATDVLFINFVQNYLYIIQQIDINYNTIPFFTTMLEFFKVKITKICFFC